MLSRLFRCLVAGSCPFVRRSAQLSGSPASSFGLG
jgi:hypothetical protein